MNDMPEAAPWPSRVVDEGEWAGWTQFTGDPFEEHAGPFFYRRHDDGSIRCAMRVEHKHLNGGHFVHGGALMTFADYCLFAIALDDLCGEPAASLRLQPLRLKMLWLHPMPRKEFRPG